MLDLGTFTAIHTILSLVAIVAGVGAVRELFGRPMHAAWTSTFLVTAVLTSATGYGFPFTAILPSHIVGAVALVILVVLIAARWGFRLAGVWRPVYAVSMVASEYLLVFVLVAQAFKRVPFLHDLAPTQTEPAFAIAQVLVLGLFGWLGFRATRRFGASAAARAA